MLRALRMLRAPSTAVVAAVLLAGLSLTPASPAGEEGFVALFNGKNFDGWKFVLGGKEAEAGQTFTIHDGVVIVSGKPNGYMVTAKSYKNYILRYDWRYKRPDNLEDDEKFTGNSGLLVHIQGLPEKGPWPKCVEVQGMNRDHGKTFAIFGAKGKFSFDGAALKKARHKVGEWNTTEVTSKNGHLTSKVNNALIADGETNLTEGPLGWQSEGVEIHFRNIKIKTMD